MDDCSDHGYSDVDVILRNAGVAMTGVEVQALIAGVAAAPVGYDPDAWMALIHTDPPPELRRALRARLASARQRMSPQRGDGEMRLADLRRELKRRRLAGFVVPRADSHQGEYVAEACERLRWITGFSGSAGTAVVLLDAAALFVDGRYTEQAKDEVSREAYEIRHISNEPMADWIATRLPARSRLGFDPWLHTRKQVLALEQACGRAGARLVPVESNPIDRIWVDRPASPIAPVMIQHETRYAGQSSLDKRKGVAATLTQQGEDAVVLAQPDAIAWLLNIRGGDVPYAPLLMAFAIVHSDGSVQLFCDPRKLTTPVREHLQGGVSVAAEGAFAAALAELGDRRARVRVDPDRCPFWVVQQLQKLGARVSLGDDPCLLPKSIKNATELEAIRTAHRIDGAALTRFLAWLASAAPSGDISELDAVERLEAFRREHPSYRGPSFPTISAADGNGAIVHYRVTEASNRRLRSEGLYLVDSGGQYVAATTDVTRTIAIGTPTSEMRTRFTQVLQGHIAVAMAVFPRGTTGGQLDVLARLPLWRDGVDYDHGTGHGVGAFLCVHEGPQRISKLPNGVALEPGMITSNEPGYYKAGQFGIRIENLVAVIPTDLPMGGEHEMRRFETLTLAPIDRALIDTTRLTASEREWLDSYHAKVREELMPLVDAETMSWLVEVTRRLN